MKYFHSSVHAAQFEPQTEQSDAMKVVEGNANIRMHSLQEQAEPLLFSGLIIFDPSTIEATTEHAESMYVLEGRVTVTFEDGEEIDVKPGDLLAIPGGSTSRWIVHEAFKAFFVMTH